MENHSQRSTNLDVVTVEELAAILKVKVTTIYHWKYTSKITPVIDTGRVLRFDLQQVLLQLSGNWDSRSRRSLTTRSGVSARKEDGNGYN